jgi:hypothetical protein
MRAVASAVVVDAPWAWSQSENFAVVTTEPGAYMKEW